MTYEMQTLTNQLSDESPDKTQTSSVLLSSQPSANPRVKVKESKAKFCSFNQKFLIIGIVTFMLLVIVIAIFASLLTAKTGRRCSNDISTNAITAPAFSTDQNSRGKKIKVTTDCLKKDEWKQFRKSNSREWKMAISGFNQSNDKINTLLTSPLYVVPEKTCGFIFMLGETNGSFYRVVNSRGSSQELQLEKKSNFEGDAYKKSIFYNETFFTDKIFFEVASPISELIEDINFQISFYGCQKFETLKDLKSGSAPKTTTPIIHRNDKHKSNFEYNIGGSINWDWISLNMETPGFENFVRTSSTDCTKNGLESIPLRDKYFIVLDPSTNYNYTKGVIISPLFHFTTNRVSLSLFYKVPCKGSSIHVYITPENFFALELFNHVSPQSSELMPSSKWTRINFELSVPEELKAFHILIKVKLDKTGECIVEDLCDFPKPLIALDEISTEPIYETCPSNGSTVLDCDKYEMDSLYQCKWASSADDDWPDWTVSYESSNESYKALDHHYDGRSTILELDPIGKANDLKICIRSPVMTANSNCSCTIKLDYLMKSIYVPRFSIFVKYGSDQDNKDRDYSIIWSKAGYQSDNWMQASILLNLREDTPFQIEFRVLEILQGKGIIYIDNWKFLNCDFKILAKAQTPT